MIKNNFSEKLKELRLKNKYTQKFVAEFLGLTQRQYQYCEMGHIPSQFDVIIKICAMYDIDANELFGIREAFIYPDVGIKKQINTQIQIDKVPFESLDVEKLGEISKKYGLDKLVDTIKNSNT